MTTDPRELAAAAVAYAKPRLRGWLHLGRRPWRSRPGLVLVVLAPTGRLHAAAAAFAATAVVLFTPARSTTADTGRRGSSAGSSALDHANIFLLIAGTYTPFAVLALHGDTRIAVLATVWSLAVRRRSACCGWTRRAGSTCRCISGSAGRRLRRAAAVARGGCTAFMLIAVGGACYTVGGVVYGLRRPSNTASRNQ